MIRFVLLLAGALVAFGAEARDNAPSQIKKPYALLISLDGFRYDYAERDSATKLLEFAKKGVAAKALIPVFPTSTFPNHYSIATGLYPAHHGIVENTFWDPKRNALFKFNDPALAHDPHEALVLGAGAARWLTALLYGFRPHYLPTATVVSVILLGVAALTCFVPARRASRVDPVVALRNE